MRLIFVRHGEPNYELDCLTDTGRRQAAAAARRLKNEGIGSVFSSPNGRARETASYTAELLSLPVTILPWMHEIDWGSRDKTVLEDGHPWTLGDHMLYDGFDFAKQDWREHSGFQENICTGLAEMIASRADAFMESHGYRRQGLRYLCETDQEETVALFAHGGSGACLLSRLLNLPFPYVCSVMPYDYTAVIILNFPVQKGAYTFPRL